MADHEHTLSIVVPVYFEEAVLEAAGEGADGGPYRAGHAVRATYLMSGAVDIGAATGLVTDAHARVLDAIASGRFQTPSLPSIPGLATFSGVRLPPHFPGSPGT